MRRCRVRGVGLVVRVGDDGLRGEIVAAAWARSRSVPCSAGAAEALGTACRCASPIAGCVPTASAPPATTSTAAPLDERGHRACGGCGADDGTGCPARHGGSWGWWWRRGGCWCWCGARARLGRGGAVLASFPGGRAGRPCALHRRGAARDAGGGVRTVLWGPVRPPVRSRVGRLPRWRSGHDGLRHPGRTVLQASQSALSTRTGTVRQGRVHPRSWDPAGHRPTLAPRARGRRVPRRSRRGPGRAGRG